MTAVYNRPTGMSPRRLLALGPAALLAICACTGVHASVLSWAAATSAAATAGAGLEGKQGPRRERTATTAAATAEHLTIRDGTGKPVVVRPGSKRSLAWPALRAVYVAQTMRGGAFGQVNPPPPPPRLDLKCCVPIELHSVSV